MTKKQEREQEKQNAIMRLKETLSCVKRKKRYDGKFTRKIYTRVNHVSKSGMSRSISVYVVIDDNMENITYFVARATESKIDQKHGGVKIGGCGMDMGFALVDQVMYALGWYNDWQDKFKQEWI